MSPPNTTPPLPEPKSEFIDNTDTGVEVESDPPPRASDPEPWDPEKIRIHTKHYSLRQVVDMVSEKDLDLAPDFQRQYVWKDRQQSGLIESLLLGIPLPSFYFNEDLEGRMQVVDGVQRLTTIYRFVHEKAFRLQELTYLDLEGRAFDELDGVFRRRLVNSQFVAHVIDPQTPYRVKFDIFRRLNTGGTPLSAQEIRHCMSAERSRSFLKRLAETPSFASATGGSLVNHPRMADREVILRFVAYCMCDVSDYATAGSLDEFLGAITSQLDNPAEISDRKLEVLENRFNRGMTNANLVFGEHAFRVWPLDQERRNPVNRALFETWGVVLSSYDEAQVVAQRDRLVEHARQLMTTDVEFIQSIRGSTGDVSSVKTRFARVSAVASKLLGDPA